MTRLRILHVLRAPVGGLFRHVRDLAIEQVARGHEVGVVVSRQQADALTDERLRDLERHLPLGLHRLAIARTPGLADASPILETRSIARTLGIDVLHGHGAKGGLYARLAGDLTTRFGKGPRRFYTPHGGSIHYFGQGLKGRIYLAAETRLAALSDGLIFESAFARDAFLRAIPELPADARVVPNGLSPSDFEPRELAPDAAEILFVGELRDLKGIDVLLEALVRLPGPRAVIVGDGPDAAALRDLCLRLGLGARVRFTGAMPARQAFSLGRILVMPSRAESLPYIALEAAAAGLPLIATRVGGVPEIVAGTDTRLVPPGDAEALACAIAHAIDDADAGLERAGRLREAVGRRFTVAAMTEGVLQFYADALEGARMRTAAASPGGAAIYLNDTPSSPGP